MRKNVTKLFYGLALVFGCAALSTAQNTTYTSGLDKPIIDQLQNDFNNRHLTMPDIPVNWYNSDFGYCGTYSINGLNFMVIYDKNVNYVETLNKKQWNENAPISVRSAFVRSEFRNGKIVCYWEAIDTARTGYLIELNDNSGNVSSIWSDAQGNFSMAGFQQ